MKLKAPEPKLPASQLRLSVPGKLMATLEDYARYYEVEHSQAIAIDQLVLEMLGTFTASDMAFNRWRKGRAEVPARRSVGASRAPAVTS
jgi:hypothetical protein